MISVKLWFPELDILKSTAIVLIVFCHIDNYVSCYELIRLVDDSAALIGLSIFFFISGFLLSQTDSVINSIKDIQKFYMKKFIRIFPLYWVALASLVIIFGLLKISPGQWKSYDFSLNNVLIHFFGLQGIFPIYTIQSMWFVGVIVIFYILYPIIVYLSENSLDTFAISSIILIFLAIFHFFFGLFDINVLMYYPIFMSGIFVHQIVYSSKIIADETLLKRILIWTFILIFVIFLMFIFLKSSNINLRFFSPMLRMCAMIPLSIFLIIFTRLFIKIRGNIMSIISSIAFATYAIYLFQHQFLAFFSLIIDFIILNTIHQDIIILTVGFAGAILCGIIIQKVEHDIFTRLKEIINDNFL